jgi:hypothetical protein
MKRFVTYLYECERGNKLKNVGFVRVNVRDKETRMELYLRNLHVSEDSGQLFMLRVDKGLQGMELGTVKIVNGQGDKVFSFETENINGSQMKLKDIVGVGIRLTSGVYIASCWKDICTEDIVRGQFDTVEENLVAAEEIKIEETRVMESNIEEPKEKSTTYEKIDLSQIRDFPSPNWHLVTNSFLVHGFWNYGYLVLKKKMEEGKETLALGIPGIYEKPEAVMAVLFGFPDFEEVPEEMIKCPMNQVKNFSQKETNQEAVAGTFGCWFVDLKV